jgi:hypothetical protein
LLGFVLIDTPPAYRAKKLSAYSTIFARTVRFVEYMTNNASVTVYRLRFICAERYPIIRRMRLASLATARVLPCHLAVDFIGS